MLIGAMNHPANAPLAEIEWMGRLGLDFIDLTLEPPAAAPDAIDVPSIAQALRHHRLKIVGHTAYYLPFCSPFPRLRRAAIEETKQCLEIFAELGVSWVNLHPDRNAPFHNRAHVIYHNLRAIEELLQTAQTLRVGLMIENIPGAFNTAEQLSELLNPLPDLGLHLDIGHANLMVEQNTSEELIAAFPARLRHVHLHDNNGGAADLHLPLGAGNIDVPRHLRALIRRGYDHTITLEVFSRDRRHFIYSRDLLRELWSSIAAGAPPG